MLPMKAPEMPIQTMAKATEVWKSWHEPTSGGLANAEVLHHLAEPRLCGGSAHSAGRGREVVLET